MVYQDYNIEKKLNNNYKKIKINVIFTMILAICFTPIDHFHHLESKNKFGDETVMKMLKKINNFFQNFEF